jgi:hypothetical protein
MLHPFPDGNECLSLHDHPSRIYWDECSYTCSRDTAAVTGVFAATAVCDDMRVIKLLPSTIRRGLATLPVQVEVNRAHTDALARMLRSGALLHLPSPTRGVRRLEIMCCTLDMFVALSHALRYHEAPSLHVLILSCFFALPPDAAEKPQTATSRMAAALTNCLLCEVIGETHQTAEKVLSRCAWRAFTTAALAPPPPRCPLRVCELDRGAGVGTRTRVIYAATPHFEGFSLHSSKQQ